MKQRLAALDLEATCLRPGCRVVSLALVPIHGTEILLGEAVYAGEPPGEPVGETALIHGVTADSCPSPAEKLSMEEALRLLQGYTLVVYGRHDVELAIGEAERRGVTIEKLCYKDVMAHLLRSPSRLEKARARGRYTLEDALEELLGLRPPHGRIHDPLSDAVHTALLYIALRLRGDEPETRCTSHRSRGLLPRLLRSLLGRH